MRVYFDMCCYNRPYDDQSQIKVSLETQAKLHIQNLIHKEAIGTGHLLYASLRM